MPWKKKYLSLYVSIQYIPVLCVKYFDVFYNSHQKTDLFSENFLIDLDPYISDFFDK